MAYTTKAKVDALDGGNINATLFASLLASVTAFINRYVGKSFEAASATKYYDGNDRKCLLVDSFVGSPTVTILNIDGTDDRILTEGHSSDYLTAPYNSTEKSSLELTGNGWYGSWPKGQHRVKVVATFGQSSSVPSDVEYAATKLISDLAKVGAGTKAKSETLGDYSITYDDIANSEEVSGVLSILDSYRDIDI